MNDVTDEFRASRVKTYRDAFEHATGLVLEYKPFILKKAKWFADRYRLPIWWVLDYAVSIANRAEQKFDPGQGNKFGTPLALWLLGLHRHCQRLHRMRYGDHQSEAYRNRPRPPSHKQLAEDRYGDDDPRPFLLRLDRNQQQSLRLSEKAVLDWMLEPAGRTLSQVAEWIGISKGYASKLRYRLLIKSRAN